MCIIGSGTGKIGKTKDFDRVIVRNTIVEDFKRTLKVKNWCRQPIYEKSGKLKSKGPIGQWNTGMSKHSQSHFKNMPIFPFYLSILFRSIRTRNPMFNPIGLKKF